MNIKLKSIISALITFSLILNITIPAFATEEPAKTYEILTTDDLGNTYQISVHETGLTRTTRLTDISGNVILSLVYNIETGTLRNPDNGATMLIPSPEIVLTPCKVLSSGDKDYEYEFCSLGDSYTKEYSITANEILNMAATTVLTVMVVQTVLIAATGGIAFTTFAKNSIQTLASAVFQRIDIGNLNFTVYYKLKYFCAEFYESDLSYPDGGFWFLGYTVSNNYYSGRIG